MLVLAPGTGTLVGLIVGNCIGLAAMIEDLTAGDTEVAVGVVVFVVG